MTFWNIFLDHWDVMPGLVQVRITGHCTAAPHTASQSTMKVSVIVKKRLSHTLWPHWGKPSVTSEVTGLCGRNFMRHQRLSGQRQNTNSSSQNWQIENIRQRVVLYFQSASRELSETNVGENVVVSLVNLLICSHTKGVCTNTRRDCRTSTSH